MVQLRSNNNNKSKYCGHHSCLTHTHGHTSPTKLMCDMISIRIAAHHLNQNHTENGYLTTTGHSSPGNFAPGATPSKAVWQTMQTSSSSSPTPHVHFATPCHRFILILSLVLVEESLGDDDCVDDFFLLSAPPVDLRGLLLRWRAGLILIYYLIIRTVYVYSLEFSEGKCEETRQDETK